MCRSQVTSGQPAKKGLSNTICLGKKEKRLKRNELYLDNMKSSDNLTEYTCK